jgi:hypothetical protein
MDDVHDFDNSRMLAYPVYNDERQRWQRQLASAFHPPVPTSIGERAEDFQTFVDGATGAACDNGVITRNKGNDLFEIIRRFQATSESPSKAGAISRSALRFPRE